MRRRQRLFAVLAIAALCAPGTWLRSPVMMVAVTSFAITPLPHPQTVPAPAPAPAPGWRVEGVWHIRAEGPRFGGFSALLAVDNDRLRAFTDRGNRMSFTVPGHRAPALQMYPQPVAEGRADVLTDSESATSDPVSGRYWLSFEQVHTIHRFTRTGEPDGLRDLSGLVDWPNNGGIEAMVRLADGRFVVLPETGHEGLIFARDPVEGGTPAPFRFRSPVPGYVATDMAQLPDGRLLVLMRKLLTPSRSAWPPFAALLAVGPVPAAGGRFAPVTALRLDSVLPGENYEGLALRPRGDGRVEVWIIADDNFSLFQRTLLAQLVFDPAA